MRLFIAINFNDEFKQLLSEDIDIMKKSCFQANYTHKNNLHLTLAFIGETSNITPVKTAMEKTYFDAFDLYFGSVGNFYDLYYREIKKTAELVNLQKNLTENLVSCGVKFDKKQFKPHITLARQTRFADEPLLPKRNKKMTVEKISLMKSERINGHMVYTEIFSKSCR